MSDTAGVTVRIEGVVWPAGQKPSDIEEVLGSSMNWHVTVDGVGELDVDMAEVTFVEGLNPDD